MIVKSQTIILQAFRQEMILPLGIKLPHLKSMKDSLGKWNLTTLVRQSIEAKQACQPYEVLPNQPM